jgi:hypothetical protein
MNKKNLLSSAVAAALLASVISQNALAATDTGTANARIVTPITITAAPTPMNFGDIQPEAGATTVTLSTGGVATPSGATVVTGSPSQGVFTVTGTAAATYSITLPADGTVSLTGPGSPATDMAVNGFNHDAGGTPTIGGGGSSTLNIGAVLSVAGSATQTAGDYSGTYDVTVDYQ